ncbi:MAG: polymer-forming cytoskeletal protein [Betaproteobacteria bacterium]|nr:polymer-forming cytoskeletal protein [Betaproteobacteria bacterium]
MSVFNKRRDKEDGDLSTHESQGSTPEKGNGTAPGSWGMKSGANGSLKPSVISEGFEFIGEIRSNGYLTIDGTVRGKLSLHSVQIGSTGTLDGNLVCETVHVKGNFSGSLDCSDLTIGSRAVVDGKLSYKSITIQRGGIVKGELRKKS